MDTNNSDVTMLDWALYYLTFGFKVIPLHHVKASGTCSCPKADNCGKSTGKHPHHELVPNGVLMASGGRNHCSRCGPRPREEWRSLSPEPHDGSSVGDSEYAKAKDRLGRNALRLQDTRESRVLCSESRRVRAPRSQS